MKFIYATIITLFLMLSALAVKAEDESNVKWYCTNVVSEYKNGEWHICGKSYNLATERIALDGAIYYAYEEMFNMTHTYSDSWNINPQRTVCSKDKQTGKWGCIRYFIMTIKASSEK